MAEVQEENRAVNHPLSSTLSTLRWSTVGNQMWMCIVVVTIYTHTEGKNLFCVPIGAKPNRDNSGRSLTSPLNHVCQYYMHAFSLVKKS